MEISCVVSALLLLLLLSINKGKATDVLPLVEAVDRSGNILEQVTPDLIDRHVRTGKIFYFVGNIYICSIFIPSAATHLSNSAFFKAGIFVLQLNLLCCPCFARTPMQ